MLFRFFLIPVLITTVSFAIYGQRNIKLKFGKVSKEELLMTDCDFEEGAEAVILGKKARLNYQLDPQDRVWMYTYTEFIRIKILTEEGKRFANRKIRYYSSVKSKRKELIKNVKATTYNIDKNGSMYSDKIDNDQRITTRINPYFEEMAITFPQVNVGSVIELEYRVQSYNAGRLPTFYFQYDIPVQQVEYEYTIPRSFEFQVLLKGHQIPLEIDKKGKTERLEFEGGSIRSVYSLETTIKAKQIPSYALEPFVANVNDIPSRLSFQMTGRKYSDGDYFYEYNSYDDLRKSLMRSEYFGKVINHTNDYSRLINFDLTDPIASAEHIHSEYSKNFNWNQYTSYTSGLSQAEFYRTKSGSSGDLNLHMIAAMKQAGLDVYPMLLSTRGNGRPNPQYVDNAAFDYVVACVQHNGTYYFFDASEDLGKNVLPYRTLNADGLILKDDQAVWYNYTSKQSCEKSLLIDYSVDKNQLLCTLQVQLNHHGLHEEFDLTENSEETFEEQLQKKLESWKIRSIVVDSTSLHPNNFELVIHASLEIDDPEFIYIEPFPLGVITSNPFTASERVHNIDFPYGIREKAYTTINIPVGYTSEIPESKAISVDTRSNKFIYNVSSSEREVKLLSNLSLSLGSISNLSYEPIKDFYEEVSSSNANIVILSRVQ